MTRFANLMHQSPFGVCTSHDSCHDCCHGLCNNSSAGGHSAFFCMILVIYAAKKYAISITHSIDLIVCGLLPPGGVLNANGTSDLDGGDLVSWLNCECVFSLIFVGLLAALPFNLHTQELMQTPETYVARAIELSGERAYDKVRERKAAVNFTSLPLSLLRFSVRIETCEAVAFICEGKSVFPWLLVCRSAENTITSSWHVA